ncbi:MAG: arsenite methyltransferase [Gaiellaceae bacterium]|nr:arsenite methyltransferase [Gaiellaceae bacterium]
MLEDLLAREPNEIVDGIPRFVESRDEGQAQVQESFAYKWDRRETYDSDRRREIAATWILERYGFDSVEDLSAHLAAESPVLDVGCGAGYTAATWLAPGWGGRYVGADISRAVDVARERLEHVEGTSFLQADVLDLPFRRESFGAIMAEGVLHHTPSTEAAFKALVPLLRPGGELLVYVYRRKAPLRELADDYLRDRIAALPAEQAWEELRPLTRLAQALSELELEVDVPEDVPLLGIAAGRHDVQRLIYWHFAKLFWHPELSLEENNHVQFDWYHPRYAHRHTEDELLGWCDDEGLEVVRLDVQESGLTLRARKA